ncbi:MAG TPA: hypothetical protein VFT45_00610 [Longimicrobium sp.]|nr:hypothetical protein [Longimicrobium sp.]
MPTLSREAIHAVEQACAAELRRGVSHDAQHAGRLHLDPSALVEVLALQLLLPFLVAVTSEFAVQRLTALKLKRKSRAELRQSLTELEGKPLRAPGTDELDACVRIVEEVLVPMGWQPEDARRIVTALGQRLDSHPHPGGTDEVSQPVPTEAGGPDGRG